MRMTEECAGCFRRRGSDESLNVWVFWKMTGGRKGKPALGAWLCLDCYQVQQERLIEQLKLTGRGAKPDAQVAMGASGSNMSNVAEAADGAEAADLGGGQ